MTEFDPFAAAPADEPTAQAQPTASAPTQTATEAPSRPALAVSGEGKVVVTLKGGAGYDAPWIVIHATTLEEALSYFAPGEPSRQMTDLMQRVQQGGQLFSGAKPAAAKAQPSQSAPQQTQQSSAPAGAQTGPQGAKYCKHGEMNFKSGFNQQKGKAWSGYFCPTPKGTPDQCKPEFDN